MTAELTLKGLSTFPIWVGWRNEKRDGHLTKIPYNPRTGAPAKSNDSSTWGTRAAAEGWSKRNNGSGTGVELSSIGDGLSIGGIDLDSCRDPVTGVIDAWALEVMVHFPSYAEVSPSGTGIKIFVLLRDALAPELDGLFGGEEKTGLSFKRGTGEHPPAIEIYRRGRYFTVTEQRIGEREELKTASLPDLRWLIEEAGPALKGNGATKEDAPPQKKEGVRPPRDESRSGKAFRAGKASKAQGASFEEMREDLLGSEDEGTAEWARTKGSANGEREAHKIWDKAEAPGETITLGGGQKILTTVARLNERYAILQARGSASVFVSRADFLPIQDCDLKRRLGSEVVYVGQHIDGTAIYKPAYKFWTEHAHRHVYRDVVFSSKPQPPSTYNLYRGLGVAPKEGICELQLQHIREVICSGNEPAFQGLVKLMAWQIQNIGKPSRIGVVLISENQQAGKGFLLEHILLKIYGPSGFNATTVDQVFGKFNDAIRGRAFCFLDEVVFAGDHKTANAVKSLITKTEAGIETKNVPVVMCPIGVNIWLASNYANAAHIEETDKRFLVLRCAEHRIDDTEYFKALDHEVEDGGREAFAHWLLNLDLNGFVPSRDINKESEAKEEMKWHSINFVDARKWVEASACAELILGMKLREEDPGTGRSYETGEFTPWVEGAEFPFGKLAVAYANWAQTRSVPGRKDPTRERALPGVLQEKCGFAPSKRVGHDRVRTYILPSTEHCLLTLGTPTTKEA